MLNKQKLTRRQALKFLGVSGAVVYVAACAAPVAPQQAQEGGAASGEPKAISISHIGGGNMEASEQSQRMQMLRAAFPDIQFENQWVSYAGYLEKIPLSIASGDIADIQFCNAFNDIPLMMENQIIIETGPLSHIPQP